MQPIIEALTAYRPHFATADYSPAAQWIAEGCDIERDILPTIEHWTQRKPDIYSVGFFTKYVREAKQQREQAEKRVHRQAVRIAFLTRKLGRVMPTDTRWLEAYETRYGPVNTRMM